MTKRDLSLFSLRHLARPLTADEIDDASDMGSRDPDEGANWLPWYKAALGCLAQLVGRMSLHLETGQPPTAEGVAAMKRLWLLHMLYGGIGPTMNIVQCGERRKYAEREADELFAAMEAKANNSGDIDMGTGWPGKHTAVAQ